MTENFDRKKNKNANSLRLSKSKKLDQKIKSRKLNGNLCLTCTLKEYIKENEILAPIKLRDALFGVRKNTLKLCYNCKPSEHIMYFNSTFMYFDSRIITENFNPSCKYFALIRCKILSLKGLKIPVLPPHINKK